MTLGRVDLAHLLIATLRDSRVQIVSQNIQNVISNTMRLGDLDGSGRLDFHEYTIMLQNPDNRCEWFSMILFTVHQTIKF